MHKGFRICDVPSVEKCSQISVAVAVIGKKTVLQLGRSPGDRRQEPSLPA